MQPKKEANPQMHTAEHILNQTMVQMFNKGRAFSAHIEKKKSKCDYKNFTGNLTDNEIALITEKVNQIINADLPVFEEFITKKDAELLFNLDRLPDDSGDELRIVKIGDYDACPCIGYHVKSTKEIGGFRIISTGFEEGILRIRFKLG